MPKPRRIKNKIKESERKLRKFYTAYVRLPEEVTIPALPGITESARSFYFTPYSGECLDVNAFKSLAWEIEEHCKIKQDPVLTSESKEDRYAPVILVFEAQKGVEIPNWGWPILVQAVASFAPWVAMRNQWRGERTEDVRHGETIVVASRVPYRQIGDIVHSKSQ